jgi:hypothetical protein
MHDLPVLRLLEVRLRMWGPVIPAPILHEKRKTGLPLTFRFTVYSGFAIQMVEGDSALASKPQPGELRHHDYPHAGIPPVGLPSG